SWPGVVRGRNAGGTGTRASSRGGQATHCPGEELTEPGILAEPYQDLYSARGDSFDANSSHDRASVRQRRTGTCTDHHTCQRVVDRMRLCVLSDLHLEYADLPSPLPTPDADACVVAGELCRARQIAFTG